MKSTFLDHLNIVVPNLQPSLLGEGSSGHLAQLCSLFPYDTTQDFGFESRLGDPKANCDFFLQIRKGTPGALMLAGKSSISNLSGQLLEDPFWQRIVRLFQIWTDAEHIISQSVEVFWLEFDYQETGYNLTPNLFFRIAESSGEDRITQWKLRRYVLDEIYRILFDIPFPSDLADNLKVCIDALPNSGGLYQIGFMIPRKTEAIRLVLAKIRLDEIENYLNKIDWPGEMGIVKNLAGTYSSKFDYFVININIGKTILPYLSFEMYFQNLYQPQFGPRWGEVMDSLESEQLLTSQKRSSLVRFCGKIISNGLFPVRYFNGINHLKLVYKRNSPIECKGYFGTMIRTVD
jgi:hypothetical protein